MAQKTVKLKKAVEFVKDNGYVLAVYKRDGNHYKLLNKCYTDDVDVDTDITVRTTGAATDFNEFKTKDKDYHFILHNNFNIPDTVPANRKDNFQSSKK